MTDLSARVMAVLFAAAEPVSVAHLAAAVKQPAGDISQALHELDAYLGEAGALQLSSHGESYTLTTSPLAAEDIARYFGRNARSDLSRPALETLAVVAYRGPVTLTQIDAIRGVSSDTMVRNLLSRELIVEDRTIVKAGRGKRYAVGHGFLELLGLKSLSDLPPLPDTGHGVS